MFKKGFLVIILIAPPLFLYAQSRMAGRVFDEKTKDAIPFATVKFGNTGQGVLAGLDGKFEVPAGQFSAINYLEVSCLGYKTKKITSLTGILNVYLMPEQSALNEIVVKPPYEKMRRIINNAIANKNRNNPDKYDWYRCRVYYKMVVDASFPDTLINDTSKSSQEMKEFFDKQHLLMSETYSIRTWQKPQHLQEDIIASRFSGFKKSVFNTLVTDVIPFHAYHDYITLNGKDYHNPVSRGFEQYYKFNLSDEILQGNDTVWILSFRPKGNNANNLTGKVYINSNGYAISQIIAKGNDTILKLSARIEQQYEQVPLNDSETRWFPRHLNYIIDWQQRSSKRVVTFHMKGNSGIDSVDFKKDDNFRFDKAHTVRLKPNGDELSDSTWKSTRPRPLDQKEAETYRVIDSLGAEAHADNIMGYLSKLPDGRIPIGPVDLDLKRLLSFNKFENTRLGLGLQTNEKILKWGSIGGWGGYGFSDGKWKYGAFGEVYADRYKEFVFKVAYDKDINEPGRVHLNRDLDKTYLKYLLLSRVDEITSVTASVKKRLGYWNIELSGSRQDIIPEYSYAYHNNGKDYLTFTATEASLSFRYAFAERSAPFFGTYTRSGTRYPIWYGRITQGNLESGSDLKIPYTQLLTAIQWHKHVNRLGYEHFLLEGGKQWSDVPLPLSKLFAGNGFNYDTKSVTLYSFGGMMTMYPYEYYADQFVNFVFRHDFDWKLFKVEDNNINYSSAPDISLQYNLLYGTLAHPEAQRYVAFDVPDYGYHEAGLLLNNLLRMRVGSIYYLTYNLGYFHHITPDFNYKKNGRFVIGLGIEL
jgi:Family of unknown function (DUF5686)/CarboxypepD_reg-like domain